LLDVGRATGMNSYQDCVKLYMGSASCRVVEAVLFLDCFGATAAFMNFMFDFIHDFIGIFTTSAWFDNKALIIMILTLLFIFPLCLPQSVTRWRFLTALCTLPIFYVILMLFVSTFLPLDRESSNCPSPRVPPSVTFNGVANSCSIFFFAFMCHMNVFPVNSELANPTVKRSNKMLISATICMLVAYGAVGAFGYHLWGSGLLTAKDGADVSLGVKEFPMVRARGGRGAISSTMPSGKSHFSGTRVKLYGTCCGAVNDVVVAIGVSLLLIFVLGFVVLAVKFCFGDHCESCDDADVNSL
ncbi:hypothetical protein FOZ63_032971, partial [Perkinsus olseni]